MGNRLKFIFIGAIAIPFLAIISYGLIGFYIRMIADDFCVAAPRRLFGLLGSVEWQYQNWSGAYVKFFILNLLPHLFGIWAYQLATLGVFLGWILAWTWLIYPIFKRFLFQYPFCLALFCSVWLTFIYMYSAPSNETIYWWAVIASYPVPVLLLVFYCGWMLRVLWHTQISKIAYILHFFVAWIVGASHEQVAVWLVGFLVIVAIITWYMSPKERRQFILYFFIIGLIGALIAFLTVTFAPGTIVRQNLVIAGGKLSLIDFFVLLLQHVLLFWLDPYGFLVMVVTMLLCGVLVYNCHPKDSWRSVVPQALYFRPRMFFLSSFMIVLCITIGSIVPPLYGQQSIFPRTLTLARVFQLVLAIGWGVVFGILYHQINFRRRVVRFGGVFLGIAVALVVLIPIQAIHNNLGLLPRMERFAQSWELRDTHLRQYINNGAKSIVIPPLETNLNGFLWGTDIPVFTVDEGWVSGCIANYYGFEALTLTPNTTEYLVIR
jgi:hypothetical protein